MTVCPWPPVVGLADAFIERMRQQLFSVRHRYARDPMFPGWTFSDPNGNDNSVIRYDDEDGNFWLWHIDGERSADGYYLLAKWRD